MPFPVAPLKLDKPQRRGAELHIRLTVLKADGSAEDITGATFTANVRTGEAKDAAILIALTQTVVSLAGGVIDFTLDPSLTIFFTSGIDYWVSVWVSHPTWTGGIDRLELHGRMDIVG